MSVDNWIRFWQNHDGSGYHGEDRKIMKEFWTGQFEIDNSAIPDFRSCKDFQLKKKDRGLLHPRLRPVPYVGNVRTATLILAMLNPTVGCEDYQDDERSDFHELLRANLRQENAPECFAVDKTSLASAPSWSRYYCSVFNRTVQETAKSVQCKEKDVWAELKRCLAILELVPYYSKNGSMLLPKPNWYEKLPSVQHA